MCDRPLPQQQLCADLADLIWVLPASPQEKKKNKKKDGEEEEAGDATSVVVAWLRGFWATMAREWTTGIDVLRMEKFMLLVRRVMGASLVWMQEREEPTGKKAATSARGKKRAANGEAKATTTTNSKTTGSSVRWDKKRVDAVMGILADWPFRPDEESRREPEEDDLMPKIVPVGLKLHALDIWVDEAEKAGLLVEEEKEEQEEEEVDEKKNKKNKQSQDDEKTLSGSEVLQRLNGLVTTLRSDTHSPAVRIRSKDSVADDRLPWNRTEEDDSEAEGDEWGGLDD